MQIGFLYLVYPREDKYNISHVAGFCTDHVANRLLNVGLPVPKGTSESQAILYHSEKKLHVGEKRWEKAEMGPNRWISGFSRWSTIPAP